MIDLVNDIPSMDDDTIDRYITMIEAEINRRNMDLMSALGMEVIIKQINDCVE